MNTKNYKILTGLLFVLALIMLVTTIYVYFQIKSACIPSYCNELYCTMDCEGARSYNLAIYFGLMDAIFWGLGIGFISWIKRRR